MSTPPEQTALPEEDAPERPKRSKPHVRDLTVWHIPFHYLPPIVVAAIGIAMLNAGGFVGGFGGWWLAAALPIAIGAFLRSPWFAILPLLVWTGWLTYVNGEPPDATLANTPWLLGVPLALISAGATVLAQRAVFPATAPAAWEASPGRLVPPLDDGEPVELDAHPADHTIEFAVVEPIEATEEELEGAALAAMTDATVAEISLGAEAEGLAKTEAEAEKEDEAEDLTEAEDLAEAEKANVEDEYDAPESVDSEVKIDLVKATAADDQVAEAEEPLDAPATPEPAVSTTPVTELPLDADPAPLDEGGHVTEFKAISAADLADLADGTADGGPSLVGERHVDVKPQDSADEETSQSDTEGTYPADVEGAESAGDENAVTAGGGDAPLPAATQAGRRRGRR